MVPTPKIDVVLDTSVLVNFLAIDRVDLLAGLSTHRFFVTAHVRKEVTYPEQIPRLEAALSAGSLEELAAGTHDELATFAKLTVNLGVGESAAIAAASHRNLRVGLEDRAAVRRAESEVGKSNVVDTTEIVLRMIQARLLTVAQADAIKEEWAANHRFVLSKFESFADLPLPGS